MSLPTVTELSHKIVGLQEAFALITDTANKVMPIKDKNIVDVLKEQTAYPIWFMQRAIEFNRILKQAKLVRNVTYHAAIEQILATNGKAMGERVLDKIASTRPDVVAVDELIIELETMVDGIDCMVNAIDRRGFSIKEWVTVRVNDLNTESL